MADQQLAPNHVDSLNDLIDLLEELFPERRPGSPLDLRIYKAKASLGTDRRPAANAAEG